MQFQVEVRRGGRVIETRVVTTTPSRRNEDGIRKYLRGETVLPAFLECMPSQSSCSRSWRRPGNY